MYASFIKEQLLAKRRKAYSLIVAAYRQQLDSLQPAMFRRWLAKEIALPEDTINLSSLNSALSRQRKREKTEAFSSNHQFPAHKAVATLPSGSLSFTDDINAVNRKQFDF